MSYTKLLYHIVFRTKGSRNSINEIHEKELYAYILGYVRNNKSTLYRIGGMPDHIHILVDIHPTDSVTEFVRILKESASKWLQSRPEFPNFNGWGESFAASTYSQNDIDTIINYIKNQKDHHQKVSFADEYRQFLISNGVEPDERYFLKE